MCASGDNVLRAIIRSGSKQKGKTKCAVAVSQHWMSTRAFLTRLELQEQTWKGRRQRRSRVDVNWESFLEMFGPFAMRSLVAVAGAYFRGAGSKLSPFERYLFPLHRHLEICISRICMISGIHCTLRIQFQDSNKITAQHS